MRADFSSATVAYLAMVFSGLVLLAAWMNARRLRQRNEDLARLAEERAGALERALREAEAANAAKGDFLAVMSHELRTPVHAILGMTELLLDSPLGRDQQDQARSVQRAGRGLLGLVNDILDFSKIEAGKLALRSVSFDLRELVEDVVDLHAVEAREKELDLVLHWDAPDERRLMGDPDRLRQVLQNLLGNALKFTARGYVVVKVEALETLPDQVSLRVAIEDTGCGIHSDKRDHLFEPFTQEDTSITRRFGGTGLGLAISKRLVEGMGGRIGFDSAQHQGSCFWMALTFPFSRESTEPPGPWRHPAFRVLVVEPLKVAREALSARFRRWGVAHETAASWSEALEVMKVAGEADFDLVLVAEGLEIDPASTSLPVVLVCPMHLQRDARALQHRGFAGILRQPVLAWELWELLERGVSGAPWLGPETAPEPLPAASPHGRFRALVGEDNPLHQEVVRRMVQGLGGEVMLAGNGLEVLSLVESQTFDLILLDGQMPGLDGLGAARSLRARGVTTPILAMTAHALPGDRERFLTAGMNGFLTKPFSRADLTRALQDVWPEGGILGEETGGQEAFQGPLDHEGLLAEERRSPGSIRELVALYCVHAPVRLAELRRALAADDLPSAAAACHALTGSAACIRAGELADLGRRLEAQTRAGDLEGAQAAFPAFEAAYRAVWIRLEPLAAALKEPA